MHQKGADSMAVSELGFRNTLVSIGWATSVLLCTNGLRKSSHLVRYPFAVGKLFFLAWTSGCLPRAMTIASLLMGGCGLRHKR